jgi:hypothetical protein
MDKGDRVQCKFMKHLIGCADVVPTFYAPHNSLMQRALFTSSSAKLVSLLSYDIYREAKHILHG